MVTKSGSEARKRYSRLQEEREEKVSMTKENLPLEKEENSSAGQ